MTFTAVRLSLYYLIQVSTSWIKKVKEKYKNLLTNFFILYENMWNRQITSCNLTLFSSLFCWESFLSWYSCGFYFAGQWTLPQREKKTFRNENKVPNRSQPLQILIWSGMWVKHWSNSDPWRPTFTSHRAQISPNTVKMLQLIDEHESVQSPPKAAMLL